MRRMLLGAALALLMAGCRGPTSAPPKNLRSFKGPGPAQEMEVINGPSSAGSNMEAEGARPPTPTPRALVGGQQRYGRMTSQGPDPRGGGPASSLPHRVPGEKNPR